MKLPAGYVVALDYIHAVFPHYQKLLHFLHKHVMTKCVSNMRHTLAILWRIVKCAAG